MARHEVLANNCHWEQIEGEMIFISRVLASFIWLPLGLIIWIPLLIRYFSVLAVGLTFSALAGDKVIDDTGENVARVIYFYSNGFRAIWKDYVEVDEKRGDALARKFFDAIVTSIVIYPPLVLFVNFMSGDSLISFPKFGSSDEEVQNDVPLDFRKIVYVETSSGPASLEIYIHNIRMHRWSILRENSLELRVCNRSKVQSWLRAQSYFVSALGVRVNFASDETPWLVGGECGELVLENDGKLFEFSGTAIESGKFMFRFQDQDWQEFKLIAVNPD